jgi:hypothetical protein
MTTNRQRITAAHVMCLDAKTPRRVPAASIPPRAQKHQHQVEQSVG